MPKDENHTQTRKEFVYIVSRFEYFRAKSDTRRPLKGVANLHYHTVEAYGNRD